MFFKIPCQSVVGQLLMVVKSGVLLSKVCFFFFKVVLWFTDEVEESGFIIPLILIFGAL